MSFNRCCSARMYSSSESTLTTPSALKVSSGCFGAMSIAMAGVMCGKDQQKVKQLPNTKGMRNEVIMQESHTIGYAQALTNVGAKVIKVKTAKELEKAINRKTAMLWFLNANTGRGEIKWKEFVALGKKHNIPTFIELAKKDGLKVIERPVDKTELFISDEVFLTGTAAKITPIKMIETTSMSKDMPIMNSLRKKLTKITEGLVPEYENWVKRVHID